MLVLAICLLMMTMTAIRSYDLAEMGEKANYGTQPQTLTTLLTLSLLLAMTGCSHNDAIGTADNTFPQSIQPINLAPPLSFTGHKHHQATNKQPSSDPQAITLQQRADLTLEESEAKPGSDGYYQAITLYEQLLTDYPDYQDNDQVRYQLARAYDYTDSPKQVLRVLTDLVAQHSGSSHYIEAQLRRGELLFNANRFDDAAHAYEAVIAEGESSDYYPYALYKQAWAYYKHNKLDQARHRFADLLDHLDPPPELAAINSSDNALVNDVLRVLALSFDEPNGLQSLQAFLGKREKKPYLPLIFQALAKQHLAQQLYVDAAQTYLAYAAHYSDQPFAPRYHLQAIQLFEEAKQNKLVIETRESFVKRYGPSMKFWQHHPTSLYNDLLPAIKENIILLAKQFHATYQQSKQSDDMMYAQYWYRYFLQNYPNETEAGEISFLYAENLFELGSYRKAADEYHQSAYHYPPHAKSAEAAYAALISYEKQKNIADQQRRQKLIESSERFIQHFPNDTHLAEVRYIKADQHLALEEYQLAQEALTELLPSIGKTKYELLSPAWNKLSYCLFMMKEYAKAETTTQTALEYVVYQDDYLTLKQRLASSIYKQGEAAQTQGDMKTAAEHYIRMVSTVPDSSFVPNALYDAATAYLADGKLKKSAKALELLTSGYSDHALSFNAKEKLAFIYNALGDELKTAHAYSALANVENDTNRKRSLLIQAADIYQQYDHLTQAIDLLERYQSLLKSSEAIYYKTAHRIADLKKAQGDITAYQQKLKQIIDQVNPKSRDTEILQQGANATLALAESYNEAFTKIKLSDPIREAVNKKMAAMKLALNRYRDANDFHISYITTAATFHIAEIYRHFSHALLTSPKPNGLSPQEETVYHLMLEEQAYPFEEQAITYHKLNIKRVEDGLYDQWIQQSFQALGQLQPVKFNKAERVDTVITYLN